MSIHTEVLTSWNASTTTRAITEFVERTVSDDVRVDDRIAVFDNDGTLWCEKPMPIQADSMLRPLLETAQVDPELRGHQPWKAAYERYYGWLGKVLAEHYAGDETNVRTLLAGILAAFEGITVEDFETKSDAFLRTAEHPTLGRTYIGCSYLPMVGSATTLQYTSDDRGGTITHKAEADHRNDGSQADPDLEPRGPPAAARRGQFKRLHRDARVRHHEDRPVLCLLVLHDDAQREFDYRSGAEQALEQANESGSTA